MSKNKIYKDAPQIYLYNNGISSSRTIGEVTRAHWGIDYNANVMEKDKLVAPFHAIFSGKVVDVQFSEKEGGNYVVIEASKASFHDFKFLYTRSMHHSEIFVSKGQYVKQGEVIALQGNTGAGSTGPHVHLEVYRSNVEYKNLGFWGSSNPKKFHIDPRIIFDLEHNSFISKINKMTSSEIEYVARGFGGLDSFRKIFSDINFSYAGNLFYDTAKSPNKYKNIDSKAQIIFEEKVMKIALEV